MPSAPPKRCMEPACPNPTVGRFCDDHLEDNHDTQRRQQYDRRRKNDPFRKEYLTKRWEATRQVVFARDVLCVDCGNQTARICDHCIPARIWVAQHNWDMDSFYDITNLQGLCKRCHDRKTATEDSGFAGKKKRQQICAGCGGLVGESCVCAPK